MEGGERENLAPSPSTVRVSSTAGKMCQCAVLRA